MVPCDFKADDFDLDFQGQNGLETPKVLKFYLQTLSFIDHLNVKLNLCIDYLKVLDCFKNLSLDFELDGQIGLQTCKLFVLNFYIDPFGILPLHLNCLLIT